MGDVVVAPGAAGVSDAVVVRRQVAGGDMGNSMVARGPDAVGDAAMAQGPAAMGNAIVVREPATVGNAVGDIMVARLTPLALMAATRPGGG